MKIIFFGTSEFGVTVLEKLIQAGIKPVLVVTTPDKPAGRSLKLTSSPVSILAEQLKLSLAKFDKPKLTKLSFEQLSFQPDLFVVASYGEILPKEVLDIPKHGVLNVHPSLLPKYRGPSPVHTAILNGDKNTGVTIMLLDEKMDHGPILDQREFPMNNDQFPILRDKLAELGAELLIETIPEWIEGKVKPVPQDDSKATYTKIFTKEDGKIDWNKPAQEIEQQVRAFDPWPGTFTIFEGKTLKILKALVLSGELSPTKFSAGTAFLTDDKKLGIQCGEDALLIEEVQLEGKKPTSSKDFLLGHKDIIGATLC